jgi:hypothetical protein
VLYKECGELWPVSDLSISTLFPLKTLLAPLAASNLACHDEHTPTVALEHVQHAGKVRPYQLQGTACAEALH